MVKAVLDSNVWLSGIFWRGNPYKIIKLAETKKVKFFITSDILDEILDVLSRDKFSRLIENLGLKTEELIRTILGISTLAEAKIRLKVIKEDPADNKILECAVSANVNYIVSGDRHLLELKDFKGIKIVNAKKFLEIATS